MPITIDKHAAVPNKANVVMAFSQNPKRPIYDKNAPDQSAVLMPAVNHVKTTIKLAITIQGVVTNASSNASNIKRIPYVIKSKTTSPFATQNEKNASTFAILNNLYSGFVGKLLKITIFPGKL